ncbi:hypothetical protein BGZ68_002426, partial [Mortierella alpina]
LDNQEEMKQMQQQALVQLGVLHSRVQAILTQTYELHKYPIPRLFVVLPQELSGWNSVNVFANKFRLYFLCECGEHTKSIDSSSKIPHHIHFAKHEGYEIARPSEFFKQYGTYVLTILKMLKYGVTVAGVVMPALSQLISPDVLDHTIHGLNVLQDTIVPGVDQVISWMDNDESVKEVTGQVESNEALEGADLRKLDTFLKSKDGNKVLGNLYRTVTDKGHVKWVCIDHYRLNYQEKAAKEFLRMLESVGGTFSENAGKVDVNLRSKALAELFFSVLGNARSVYELDITFGWACTTSELEALEIALKTSRVSILRLGLQNFRIGVASKVLSTSAQYDVIFRIRDLPNMRNLHVLLSKEHVKFFATPLKNSAHACKMVCGLTLGSTGEKEMKILLEALKRDSTLTTLDLTHYSVGADGAKALADALTTNTTLTTLNLMADSVEGDGIKALAEALKTNTTLATLKLAYNPIRADGAKALAEARKTNANITITS